MAKAATKSDEPEVVRNVANQIINRHTAYGAVGGLLPIPALDLAVIIGVQIKMIAELAQVYEVPFSENAVKGYVVALIGGGLPVSGVSGMIGSALKGVPVVGSLLGMFVVPGVAAASTYAVGKIFAWHFESGGTIGDFNVDAARDRFQQEFERARARVKGGSKDAAEAA
jgi:uncharacterized protein (DUF697 family)